MVLLIHHPVSPFSRKIRMLMAEKKMLFVLKEEEPWNLSDDVYKLNYAISEFLEEISNENPVLPKDAKQRAEVRRLTEWFDDKFYREVYRHIVSEKIFRRFANGGAPDSKALNIGLNNLAFHMEYIDWLAERRNYLAGEEFSLADITAAAHLSIIDYLGDIAWDGYRNAKIWYSKIKSRPSFKDILKDNIRGILPAKHYANLDF